MHERTRRNLCQLAFLAIGVLPTVCTLTWASYRVSPLYAVVECDTWEQRITALTGLIASIERVEHPPGGSTLLQGLELIDPEGNERVATIRQAEIAYRSQGVVVLLSQPEVAHGKFLRLWDTLHLRVLQGPTPTTAFQITCGELTLEVGQRSQTFTMVRCTVEPAPTSIQATIEFQLAGVQMPAPARLDISRNRQVSPPITSWSLRTDTPLPCAVFADYLEPLASFGTVADFQGSVTCRLLREHASAEIQGRFSKVDLAQLTESLPHKLSGQALIRIDRAVVEQGVLSSALGSVESPGGTVSRTFVVALADKVPLAAPKIELASNAPLIHYDWLAFQFSVSEETFSIAGPTDDVIMTARGEPLLTADRRQKYPLVALICALAPDSQFLVPATDATKSLLQLFDLPTPRSRNPPPNRLKFSDRSRP